MENSSITNLEQSKLLVKAGLDVSTADFSVLVKMKKENGIIIVEESPYPNDTITYNQDIENNKNFTAAWSLGRLIDMLPADIISQYDIDGVEQDDEGGVEYHLWIDKNYVMYNALDGRRRFLTTGKNVLDAVVEMIIALLKEDFELDD